MPDPTTWVALAEQVGPLLATVMFFAYIFYNARKQSKSGPSVSADGFSDSQKLYLEKEVVQPIVEAVKEAMK